MGSHEYLQRLQRELIEMDNDLKSLMTMLDRGQTGRLFRPAVQLDPISREKLRTRLDFARSLVIKLATLLAVPPEIPNFIDIGCKVVDTHLGRVREYRALPGDREGEADGLGLAATQVLQQLDDSLSSIRELMVPAEAPAG